MGERIFISYGRKDDYLNPVSLEEEHNYHLDPQRSFTRQLYNALTAAGFDVWWDRECLPNRGSLTFLQEIREAVHKADKVVYVSGDHAKNSDYVKAEWQYALSQCKPVIPVLRNGDYTIVPEAISMGNAPDMRDMNYFAAKVEELVRLLQDPTIPLATLYSVPNLPDWYIERGNDVAELQAAIRADALKPIVVTTRQQTVTLQGMGGLGKTTLATALCKRCDVRSSFPDGIFWLEMGKNPSVITRLGDVGAVFGDMRDEYPDEQRGKSRLSEILRNRAALIVLDDVWDHRHVEAFRVDSPASRIVVTTRNGRMAGLLGVVQHAIDTLTDEEGMALIGKRLGRADGEASAFAEDEKALSRLLGGHTLAISIAAARIAEEGAAYVPRYLQRLQERRKTGISPLGDLKMHADDKNFNLELSLSESYDELTPEMQRYFRALSVFVLEGSFAQAAAQAVWQMEDAYQAEDTLRALVKLALLTETHDGRYSLHGLLRDYGLQLLREKGEYESCFHAYATYGIVLAENFRTLPHERWNELDSDLPHIDFIGDELARQYKQITEKESLSENENKLIQLCADFAWNIQRYVNNRPQMLIHDGKSVLRGMNWLEMGLVVYARQADKSRQSTSLNNIGSAWSDVGDSRKALDFYHQALPIQREVGDKAGEATTLNNIGSAWDKLGDKRKALDFYNQALSIQREVGNKSGEATTLNNIGGAWRALGEVRKALDFYNQALPTQREVGDKVGEAASLNNIGLAWDNLGDSRKALDFYHQALPLQRELGDKSGEAVTLNNIGRAWDNLGDSHKALDFYHQALPIRQEVGDKSGEAVTLNNIGRAWRVLGEVHKALDFYHQALPIRQEVGDKSGEATTLNNIGTAWNTLGDSRKALGFYHQALPIQREVGDKSGEAATCFNMAMIYANEGDLDKAIDYLEHTVALETLIEDPNLESDRRTLERLKAQRDGTPPPSEEAQSGIPEETMTALVNLYQTQGQRALCDILKQNNLSDEAIEQLIPMIQAAASSAPAPQNAASDTLPEKTVNTWANNTAAVKTQVPEKAEEWLQALKDIREQISNQGEAWANELAFVDALLAILEDKPLSIAEDNPYTHVVTQVQAAIEQHKNENQS